MPAKRRNIVLWKWHQPGFREPYSMREANVMVHMLRRNISPELDYRIILVTDDPEGAACDTFPLWSDHNRVNNASGAHLPSCYRRLRLFDPATQEAMGIGMDERIISIDLDAVIISNIDKVLLRSEMFVGWAVRGTYHPRVFNGSMWMFTSREMSFMWKDFDPKKSPMQAMQAGYMGSDQGWLSFRLAQRNDCAGWRWPEVASFPRETDKIRRLDVGNKIIFFHGRSKPWHPDTVRRAPWLKRYYHMEDANAVQVELRSA